MRPPLNIRKPFMTRQIGCCKLCYCYCGLANTAADAKNDDAAAAFREFIPLGNTSMFTTFFATSDFCCCCLLVGRRPNNGRRKRGNFIMPFCMASAGRMTPKSVIQHVFGTRCSNAFRTPFIWSSGLSRFA